MKKIILSGLVVMGFILDALHEKKENAAAYNLQAPAPRSQSTLQNNFSGKYKDGVYTGPVADAFYGLVQVKTTITNSKISDVEFLQYPNDRRTSIEINSQAMPYLTREAIVAQNAQVDIVSGATQTSRAFRESLQGALDQAK